MRQILWLLLLLLCGRREPHCRGGRSGRRVVSIRVGDMLPQGGLLLLWCGCSPSPLRGLRLLQLLLKGGSGGQSCRRCVGSGEVVHRYKSSTRAGTESRPVGERQRGGCRLLLCDTCQQWWLHQSALLLLLLFLH